MANAAPSTWPTPFPSDQRSGAAFGEDSDLEAALLEGLSVPAGKGTPADEGPGDMPAASGAGAAVHADLEAALLEGLSVPAGKGTPADEGPGDMPAASGAGAAVHADLEAALLEGLSVPAAPPAAASAATEHGAAEPEEGEPASLSVEAAEPEFEGAIEAALVAGLANAETERAAVPPEPVQPEPVEAVAGTNGGEPAPASTQTEVPVLDDVPFPGENAVRPGSEEVRGAGHSGRARRSRIGGGIVFGYACRGEPDRRGSPVAHRRGAAPRARLRHGS